ncbi:type II toxin-antitoxin system RelE/ParE family toxin, partial [Kribbia dieselivorans]|uniref:type II toxin-antitoxin system RelE/ParE family toxin n=1 Tax=Kribbia dieselivorans TaxID=331526 RepID=UPI001C3F30C3
MDHPEARREYDALDARDAVAVDNAVAKLTLSGPRLAYPHSSSVRGANKLRELRPRGGRSVIRPL